jgi:hypothetical protein
MAEADHRLLGARDGLVSGMLVIRREIGHIKTRLEWMPERWTKKRAPLLEALAMLQRMDAELDHRRRECSKAWHERMSIEIVSSNRPAPVNPIQ